MSSFLSGLTGAVTGAVSKVANTVSGKKNNTSATLLRAASTNTKAHEVAPVGAQVTMASGATYTKAANVHTGTFGPSTKGGRRVNKSKKNKNKSKKNKNKSKSKSKKNRK
jgi:hypothetical protein